jgi:hypothetical protein
MKRNTKERQAPMSTRLLRTAVLALIPLGFIGCVQDAPTAAGTTLRLALVTGADHGGRPFSEHMTQEVTSTPPYAGDPDGTGVALITLNLGQREICWHTSVSKVALPATASHIHQAVAGVRGPIVVVLSPPDATGEAVGCRSGLDPDLLGDILLHPESYYVNVHTTEFPSGAIRAQLER